MSFIQAQERRVWWFLVYSALFHLSMLGLADVVMNFFFVSLGHDSETIGLLQGIPRLAGLITSIPVGLIATRFGTHRMIVWSTVGLVISLVSRVMFPTPAGLVLSQFLMGVFYGAQQIALAPLMIELVPTDYRTRFFAFHNVVAMVAMALGSFIGGHTPALIAQMFPTITAGAQTPFAYGATIVTGGVVLLVSLVPFYLVKGAGQRQTTVKRTETRFSSNWTYLMFLAIPMLTFGFSGGLTFPFYTLFFRGQFAQSDDAVGTIMSIGWVGMAIIPLANAWWERHFGRAKALGATMSIAACGFAVLAFAPTLALAVIAFTVAISFRNVMQPLYQPLVLDHLPPELHNMSSSMSMVMWNIGWFAATLISGYWQKTYGFGFIMSVVTVCVLLTGVSVVLIFQHRTSKLIKESL